MNKPKAEYINNICLFAPKHEVEIQTSIKTFGQDGTIRIRKSLPENLFNQIKDWADYEVGMLN